MIDQAELDRRFDHHPPSTPDIVDAHVNVRFAVKATAATVNEYAPDGREKALALTALEEALMWANAAIARRSDNRPPPAP